jgi:adenylate cyclase class IV
MYEVEVKALVNDVNELRNKVEKIYPNYVNKIYSKQFNHYFSYTDKARLNLLYDIETSDNWKQFVILPDDIYSANNLAIRTRWDSEKGTLFIIKYAINDDDAQNGVVRRELELSVAVDIDTLDEWILNNGLTYESKWSRERVEFQYDNFSICTDLNSAYGGLCEVETIIADKSELTAAHFYVEDILEQLGLQELDPQILDKMYRFTCLYWNDFYGTTKTIFNDTRFIEFVHFAK